MQIRRPISQILLAVTVIELVLLVALCSLGQGAFKEFIWLADTTEYNRVALQLSETFTATTYRTLGYPLFLSLCYLIGGRVYGLYVAVGVQLMLNIVFTWGCWNLLERIVPTVPVTYRVAATLFFFWSALGMALSLVTDFLAAFLFGLFVYGMLFWRSLSGVVLSGIFLALATVTRPTFTFIPLLLPIAAYLAARITSTVRWRDIAIFVIFSISATTFSTVRQYVAFGYLGPAPYSLPGNIEQTLYHALAEGQVSATDELSYVKEFEGEIEKRAGRPYSKLSFSEQEKYAKQIFVEELVKHPREILTCLATNFLKYLLVPVEANVYKLTKFYAGEQTYFNYVRPVLAFVCLPIWLFSLAPPVGSSQKYVMYYLLVMLFLLYVIGISAMTNFAGERMRFPVLAFLMPAAVWNVHCLSGYLRGWMKRTSNNQAAFS